MDDVKSKETETAKQDDVPAQPLDELSVSSSVSDDSIDEELLALSPPPPSLQQAIFIMIIIAFSFLLLYLFWPELRYFMKGFSEPVSLGEAADLESRNLESDSYVKLEGVPLVNRTVTFSTGTKWFSGDIYRKMAPISGNPNLMVQWHTPNPEIKQAKDAMAPPSIFAGRLKRREDLSENYNKFWPFYDCLKLHNTSECKYCIGKSDLDECRPIFTCVANYPIEVCDQTAFFSREEIEEKVQKMKTELQTSSSVDLAAELALNEKALVALDNIDILSRLVTIEEMADRVSLLTVPKEKKATVFALKKKLFGFLLQALEIRLERPLEKMASLSTPLEKKLLESEHALVSVRNELEDIEKKKQALSPLLDVSTEFAEFVEMVREIQEKLRRLEAPLDALQDWKLDGSEKGSVLLARVRDLSARVANMKLAPKVEKTDTEGSPSEEMDTATETAALDTGNTVVTGADAADTDEGVADSASADAAQMVSDDVDTGERELKDPVLAAIDTQLDEAVARVAEVGRILIRLTPGEAPRLDAWARNTDIVGSLPKPLRADRVFKSFEELKGMLANVSPAAETSLKARYRELVEKQKQKQATEKKLAGTSGLAELKLVQQFEKLQAVAKNIETEENLNDAVNMWRQLSGQYAQQEFYPWDLSNYPSVKKALAALVENAQIDVLDSEVTALEKAFAAPMYVLLDDEKPTDNPWIIFVYLAVPLMLVINIRKLFRFIADWRQHGL